MPSRLPVHGQRAAPGPPQKAAGPQDAAQALHVTVDRTKAMEHGMTVAQIYMQVAAALNEIFLALGPDAKN